MFHEVPRTLIELSDIPHDVHMAHVVAMPRINRATIGNNGGSHNLGVLLRLDSTEFILAYIESEGILCVE
jgi:hypothetical protein